MRAILLLMIITLANFSYANDDVYALEQRINELTDKIEQLTHQNNLLQKKLDKLAEDVEFRFKNASAAKPSNVKTEVVEAPVKSKNPKEEKLKFDQAYDFLKEQQYDEAEKAFTNFLEAYPKSEYAGNAYYWLGESFALRKRFDKAAVNYLQSFHKFPKNSKADISMLKLSVVLNALGKKKESCSIIAKLKLKQDSLNAALKQMLQKELAKGNCG
jgi:tol-pal system protein YbgF